MYTLPQGKREGVGGMKESGISVPLSSPLVASTDEHNGGGGSVLDKNPASRTIDLRKSKRLRRPE